MTFRLHLNSFVYIFIIDPISLRLSLSCFSCLDIRTFEELRLRFYFRLSSGEAVSKRLLKWRFEDIKSKTSITILENWLAVREQMAIRLPCVMGLKDVLEVE